jgi:hypothetical protein
MATLAMIIFVAVTILLVDYADNDSTCSTDCHATSRYTCTCGSKYFSTVEAPIPNVHSRDSNYCRSHVLNMPAASHGPQKEVRAVVATVIWHLRKGHKLVMMLLTVIMGVPKYIMVNLFEWASII